MFTAAILYPGCIEFEIMLAIELIGRITEVRIATPDGADHHGRGGITWKSSCSYRDLNPDELNCILIPGGDPGSIIDNTDIDQLLITANNRKVPIGAICAGPLLLGKASLLKDRKFTHGYGPEQLPFVGKYFEGSTRLDSLVVRDGNIVTAKAQGHAAFGIEIARAAGAITDEESARLNSYYRSK